MAYDAPGGRCRALRAPCGASGARYVYGPARSPRPCNTAAQGGLWPMVRRKAVFERYGAAHPLLPAHVHHLSRSRARRASDKGGGTLTFTVR
eukprot:867457-Prymnesium_polylepis.1